MPDLSKKSDPTIDTDMPRISTRRPGMAYERRKAAFKNWARQHFNRDQMAAAFRSLLWVAPLTILIWVYAEREQLKPDNISIPIHLVSGSPDRSVKLIKPLDPHVTALVTGPRAQVDGLREKLNAPGSTASVVVEVDKNLPEGDQQVPASRLGDDSRFTGGGLTVSKLEPEFLTVRIVKVVERDVPVHPQKDYVNANPPRFEPPTVKVRGPETAFRDAETRGNLAVYAELRGRSEIGSEKSTVNVPDVKLSLWTKDEPDLVIVGQPKVAAMIEVAPVSNRPIFINAKAAGDVATLHEWEINFPDVGKIDVSGPKDVLDALPSPMFVPFEIPNAATKGEGTAVLNYNFPKGVHLKEGTQTTINYNLTRRQ